MRRALLGLVLAMAVTGACTTIPSPPASVTPGASPSPTAVRPTLPPVSASVTEAEIFAAAAAWFMPDPDAYDGDFVYVYDIVNLEPPAAAVARAPLTREGADLSAESQAAIVTALEGGPEVRFVHDTRTVIDQSAPDHFGCRPFLDNADVLGFSMPHPRDDGTFLMVVYVDHGCQGTNSELEVAPTGSGFRVRVISSGFWIV